MEKLLLETHLECYDNLEMLEKEEQLLMEEAFKAKERAYAPYSNFMVGAALLLANGEIISGNNQENMAYPSGLCAERVAFYFAGASFPGVPILKVAVTAASSEFPSDHPIAPCGACRQAMLEYEMNQDIAITLIMKGTTGKVYRLSGVRQLLPLFFHEGGLKR